MSMYRRYAELCFVALFLAAILTALPTVAQALSDGKALPPWEPLNPVITQTIGPQYDCYSYFNGGHDGIAHENTHMITNNRTCIITSKGPNSNFAIRDCILEGDGKWGIRAYDVKDWLIEDSIFRNITKEHGRVKPSITVGPIPWRLYLSRSHPRCSYRRHKSEQNDPRHRPGTQSRRTRLKGMSNLAPDSRWSPARKLGRHWRRCRSCKPPPSLRHSANVTRASCTSYLPLPLCLPPAYPRPAAASRER